MMVKLMYVEVFPHQIQISLKSVCEKQPPVFAKLEIWDKYDL